MSDNESFPSSVPSDDNSQEWDESDEVINQPIDDGYNFKSLTLDASRYIRSAGMGKKEIREEFVKKKISEIVNRMKLSQPYIICSRSLGNFRTIIGLKLYEHIQCRVTCVCSVYIAYMDYEDDQKKHGISDFAKYNGISFHRLFSALHRIYPSIPFVLSNQDPAHHLTPLINDIRPTLSMEMKNQLADVSSNILSRFHKDMICSGRHPAIVCAAAIKMAADKLKITDGWADEKYLASLLNRHYKTLKKRIQEGIDSPLQSFMESDEPLRKTELLKAKPELPPCMKKPKLKKRKNERDGSSSSSTVENMEDCTGMELQTNGDSSNEDVSMDDLDVDNVINLIQNQLPQNTEPDVDDCIEQIIGKNVNKFSERRQNTGLIPKDYMKDLSKLDSIIPYESLLVDTIKSPKPWTPELDEHYKKIEKIYENEARTKEEQNVRKKGTKLTFEETEEKLRAMAIDLISKMAKIDPTLPSVQNWKLLQ